MNTEEGDVGFTAGTIAALAVVYAHDQAALWHEILQAAGAKKVIYHAAWIEPEDWHWAGFDKYIARKPRRTKSDLNR